MKLEQKKKKKHLKTKGKIHKKTKLENLKKIYEHN